MKTVKRNQRTRSIVPPSPIVTRIYLTPGRFDRRRGQTYNAHLGSPDGERIASDALDVEFAACRALKARGVTARAETWHAGSTFASLLIADIDTAADLTVREDATRRLCVCRYKEWPVEQAKLRISNPARNCPCVPSIEL